MAVPKLRSNIAERDIHSLATSVRQALQSITQQFTASPYVSENDYDAFTVLVANVDNTPITLTLTTNDLMGRAGGNWPLSHFH